MYQHQKQESMDMLKYFVNQIKQASIVGKDIFTNKTYEDSAPTSHNIDVPFVSKKEYTLLDIKGDGYVMLMNEDGSTKEDLKLPETEDDFNLVKEIRDQFDAGKYFNSINNLGIY